MMNEESQNIYLHRSSVPRDIEHVFEEEEEFSRMLMMYNCAIREVSTKLEVLNDDLSVKRQRNPIEQIKSRIKHPGSIASKLRAKGKPLTVESVKQNLNDVAGIRVICAFLDDIYKVADMLTKQDDIQLVHMKDYIKKPKDNGYRSLHLIIELPIFFSDRKENMRVEVQIRTIAMNFWASLEHQLKYKKNINNAESVIRELRTCADVINQTDQHMQSLRDQIVEIH